MASEEALKTGSGSEDGNCKGKDRRFRFLENAIFKDLAARHKDDF
jgi:hypothetical protein